MEETIDRTAAHLFVFLDYLFHTPFEDPLLNAILWYFVGFVALLFIYTGLVALSEYLGYDTGRLDDNEQ